MSLAPYVIRRDMNSRQDQRGGPTAAVVADMSMSLDGCVADASDGIRQVFGWYGSGDVVVPTANPLPGVGGERA